MPKSTIRKCLVNSVATLALMLTLSGPTTASDTPQLLIVGFDMSESFPVATHNRIAASAGALVARYVAALDPDDEVWLRSFGLAGAVDQEIHVTVTLGRRAQIRPRRLAGDIGNLIATIPARVRRGDLGVQNRTNIIGFLEATASTLDCQSQATKLILFTDGIEWSTQVRGDALVTGTASLPAPSGPILAGCHVEMRGVGQVVTDLNTDSRWFPLLRAQWTVFFEAAGVASFTAHATFE